MKTKNASAQQNSERPFWLLWLVTLVTSTAYLTWSAKLVGTFWIDELVTWYTIADSFALLVETCARLDYPPGYFILLKCWVLALEAVGIGNSIFVMRMMGVVGFIFIIIAITIQGRRALGRIQGLLLAILFMVSAPMLQSFAELRPYGFLCGLMTLALLFLVEVESHYRNPEPRFNVIIRLWIVYAFVVGAAMWMHLLAGVAAFALGFYWLLLCLMSPSPWFFAGGALAHAAALVSILPWLPVLRNQMIFRANVPTHWMIPPSLENIIAVFPFWLTYGRPATSPYSGNWIYMLMIGSIAILIPIIYGIISLFRLPEQTGARRGLQFVTLCACFVMLLALITSIEFANVFHATRYPQIALGWWLAGLLLLTSQGRHGEINEKFSLILMSPWICCTLVATFLTVQVQIRSIEVSAWTQDALADLRPNPPRQGQLIYVMPDEATPIMQEFLPGYQLLPLSQKPPGGTPESDVGVLRVYEWDTLQKTRDRLWEAVLAKRRATEGISAINFKDPLRGWTYIWSDHRELPRSFWDRVNVSSAVATSPADLPTDAPKFLPSQQLNAGMGWSVVEAGDDFGFMRWAMGKVSQMPLDRPLRAGKWTLILQAHRTNLPEETVSVEFWLWGQNSNVRVEAKAGWNELRIPMTVDADIAAPVVYFRHPTWKPSEHYPGNTDERDLTMIVFRAWMIQEDQGGAPSNK